MVETECLMMPLGIGLGVGATPPPRPPLSRPKQRVSCSSVPSPSSSLTCTTDTTLSLIQSSGVIACLRAPSAEVAYEAASAAIRGGISALEITMSTPGVFEVLGQLVLDHPNLALGVGTVLNVKDARKAIGIGARFLMSPATVKDIVHDIGSDEILYIPGVMTPTEILSAYDAGAKIVKVYPVSALGGVKYISALKKPFSHIPMVASQGITIESIGDYISCGGSSVVLSDAIFPKAAMVHKDYHAVYELACIASLKGKQAVQCYGSLTRVL